MLTKQRRAAGVVAALALVVAAVEHDAAAHRGVAGLEGSALAVFGARPGDDLAGTDGSTSEPVAHGAGRAVAVAAAGLIDAPQGAEVALLIRWAPMGAVAEVVALKAGAALTRAERVVGAFKIKTEAGLALGASARRRAALAGEAIGVEATG